jgi:hypothetical protein
MPKSHDIENRLKAVECLSKINGLSEEAKTIEIAGIMENKNIIKNMQHKNYQIC